MAFVWTYPDPLDPTTYPTLIYGKLRNEIFSYKIYFQQLQDAVDTLRQSAGMPAYNQWYSVQNDPLSGAKRTLRAVHYTQLKDKIDELLPYYGYNNGVIDILGRDWSNYYVNKDYAGNNHVAPYQLLQDFRDVLEFLLIRIEQWIVTENYLPFPYNQQTNEDTYGVLGGWQEGAYKEVFVIGDLGTWTFKSFDDQTNHGIQKKFGYPSSGGNVNFDVSYLPAQADSEIAVDLMGYYDEESTVYSSGVVLQYWEYDSQGNVTILDPPREVSQGYTVAMSNESYLPPFEAKCGWTGESYDYKYNSQGDFNSVIDMTTNSVFKLNMTLSGTNARVYNSAFASPPDTGTRTTYLTLTMRLLFSKFIRDPDYEVEDKDRTDPETYSKSFIKSDLHSQDHTLTITHNLNYPSILIIKVYTNDGSELSNPDITYIDKDTIEIDFDDQYEDMEGTWQVGISKTITEGQMFLILEGGIGTDWFGHSDEIGTWEKGKWIFISPATDLRVKTLDDNKYYVYEEGSWSEQDLSGGTEITETTFTDDPTYPTTSYWLVYPYSDFNAYIPFNLMTFRNYYSGEELDYNTRDYVYRWIGVYLYNGRAIASLGSYQEGVSTYSQNGSTPNMALQINKIGIEEVI